MKGSGGIAGADPYYMLPVFSAGASNPQPPFTNLAGKTQVDAKPVSGQSTCYLVSFGQSLAANFTSGNYSVTNSTAIDNICNVTGGCYRAAAPLLGCSFDRAGSAVDNVLLRLADAWVTAAKFARVVLVPASIGGSAAADWAAGGALNQNIIATFRRLAYYGITPTAVLWAQGEADTTAGTSQASYAASLVSIIATIRAQSYSGPIFVNHESWISGSTGSHVTDAQDAAVDHSNGIWAGANWDSINATGRQADNTHFNSTGAGTAASALQTAFGLYGAPF